MNDRKKNLQSRGAKKIIPNIKNAPKVIIWIHKFLKAFKFSWFILFHFCSRAKILLSSRAIVAPCDFSTFSLFWLWKIVKNTPKMKKKWTSYICVQPQAFLRWVPKTNKPNSDNPSITIVWMGTPETIKNAHDE